MVRRLGMRSRLLTVLIIPTLALVVVSAVGAFRAHARIGTHAEAAQRVEAVSIAGALINDLEQERLWSVVHVAERGEDGAEELAAVRSHTDDSHARLLSDATGPFAAANMPIESYLDGIEDHRRQILSGARWRLTTRQAAAYYDQAISELSAAAAKLETDLLAVAHAQKADAEREQWISLGIGSVGILLALVLGLLTLRSTRRPPPQGDGDARLRRTTQRLLTLAGQDAGAPSRPVEVADIIRAVAGDIEKVQGMHVTTDTRARVVGGAAPGIECLLAELFETIATLSSQTLPLTVHSSDLTQGSVMALQVAVADPGLDMTQDALDAANACMADAPRLDAGDSEILGFTLVGHLAAHLGVRVHLSSASGGGTQAHVELPRKVLATRGRVSASTRPVPHVPSNPRRILQPPNSETQGASPASLKPLPEDTIASTLASLQSAWRQVNDVTTPAPSRALSTSDTPAAARPTHARAGRTTADVHVGGHAPDNVVRGLDDASRTAVQATAGTPGASRAPRRARRSATAASSWSTPWPAASSLLAMADAENDDEAVDG